MGKCEAADLAVARHRDFKRERDSGPGEEEFGPGGLEGEEPEADEAPAADADAAAAS